MRHKFRQRSQTGQGPPSWWPEGESWPPAEHNPERGKALGRWFAAMALIVIVLVIIAMSIINHARGAWDSDREGPPPGAWPFFALLLIGAVVFVIIRKVGRTFSPMAHVVDAADRVAGGDYSVRVDPNGPPAVRSMVDAFNTMTERLESNEVQRKHLLSDIAHELRTPLAVVQGTIEGMLDEVYPMDADHLAPLLDQTQLITRLLNDLQTVATAEAGVLELHRSRTDISGLIRDVVTSFTPMASHRGVQIAAHAQERVELDIDPIRIKQVLDNLVTNALRYTGEGGSVAVALEPHGHEVLIHVSDTGRGMTTEEAARMFERFVKSSDSGGSGLGLAIAKGLVEAHGGTISAISEPGKGTTVTIRLPHP